MNGRFNKIIILILLTAVSFLSSATPNNLKIAALRVDFKVDNYEGTSGDGKFIYFTDLDSCGDYTIDPPPHDKSYFESQLKAVDNYYRSVSNGNFGIDLVNSTVFPSASESAYTLLDSMAYYNPFLGNLAQSERDSIQEKRTVELFSDAVNLSYQTDNIDFSQFDLVIVIHAGTGNELNFADVLDLTPEDIFTNFINNQMIADNLGSSGINVGNTIVSQGLILPETLNNIYFPEFVDNFPSILTICNYQYGVTGLYAMFIGQAIGLPPLWNTETDASGIGVFGLMDTGAFNLFGIVPAPPMAWNRIYMGWEQSEKIIPTETVTIKSRPEGLTKRIDINDSEYYLIENRTNWIRNNVSIDSALFAVRSAGDTLTNKITFLFDSVGAEIDENDVIISIPDYDIGLLGSGLLIWHIDESIIANNLQTYSINNNPTQRGIRLEEAGGAQDIGFENGDLFRNLTNGEIFDMWYQGNPEFDLFNSNVDGEPLYFNSMTHPNTNSNNGALTHLQVSNIGYASDIMQFTVSNDLMLSGFPDTSLNIIYTTDIGEDKTIVIGGEEVLWWSDIENIEKKEFYVLPSKNNLFTFTNSNNDKILVVLSELNDSLRLAWFEFDNGFNLTKESTLPNNISLNFRMVGNAENDEVNIVDNNEITLINTNSGTVDLETNPSSGGLKIGEQPLLFAEIIFVYISAIDLDLDGTIEVLGLDSDGQIYAFNNNSTLAPGFPVDVDAIAPILAKNILGDQKPEIVFQNSSGEIIILNNIAETLFRLTNYQNSKLIALGIYNNKNAVVTESAIWSFDEIVPNGGNLWSQFYSDELNSNIISIDYLNQITNDNNLIDKKRTYVYPNPVRNGVTKIRVYNYSADKIDMQIFDAAGYFVDEIKSSIDMQNSPWEIEWNVNDIESGVYLINLKASNDNSETSTILKVGVIH